MEQMQAPGAASGLQTMTDTHLPAPDAASSQQAVLSVFLFLVVGLTLLCGVGASGAQTCIRLWLLPLPSTAKARWEKRGMLPRNPDARATCCLSCTATILGG